MSGGLEGVAHVRHDVVLEVAGDREVGVAALVHTLVDVRLFVQVLVVHLVGFEPVPRDF